MKKQLLFILAILCSLNSSFSQISLQHTFTTNFPNLIVKLSLSGLKYVKLKPDTASYGLSSIILYNSDYSVFKTMNIPKLSGEHISIVSFISETLFDLDTLVEYAVDYTDSNNISCARICNENGSILMQRDSGRIDWVGYSADQGGYLPDNIFPDGNSSKLMVLVTSIPNYMEIYSLPGQRACLECSNGLISGMANQPDQIVEKESSIAFPNPFTDYVKIKYSLPARFHSAFINILDINGKLVKRKEIDSSSNEIYIYNEEIKQGAYLYQIIVDGKISSSDKIIKVN